MNLSDKAQKLFLEITKAEAKLGDLRVIAKEIKKDHSLADELWATDELFPRLLAILIMDVRKLTPESINNLFNDIQKHRFEERLQLVDWLMANQLTKDKKIIALLQSWQNDPLSLKRRIFWYYQARLRWTGQIPPDNTNELLAAIHENMMTEAPEVQWAMNFTAGWVGVFDQAYRDRCIQMGYELGLYKDEFVPRNCTPNYLPKFIEIEAKKRKL